MMDEGLEVDFLILADRVETVNGKLYAMGAAWDQIGVVDFAQPVSLSIAIGVMVPWGATNREHQVRLTIRDADGQPLEFRIDATFVTGRPPHLNGETQRVLFSIPATSVVLPAPGGYELVAEVDGAELKVTRFRAMASAPPQGPPPQPR